MRRYELALVISPAFIENKLKETISKVADLVKAEKGKVTKEDLWGKKPLSYPILKEKEAQFVILQLEAEGLSKEFNKKIKLTEGILRYLLLRKK